MIIGFRWPGACCFYHLWRGIRKHVRIYSTRSKEPPRPVHVSPPAGKRDFTHNSCYSLPKTGIITDCQKIETIRLYLSLYLLNLSPYVLPTVFNYINYSRLNDCFIVKHFLSRSVSWLRLYTFHPSLKDGFRSNKPY